MKRCRICSKTKPIGSFSKNRRMGDGHLNFCKPCCYLKYTKNNPKRREYIRIYRLKHGVKSIGAMHKKRFGGLREKVMERDNYCCVLCGMENEEHIQRWNRCLTVDHIDGYGRNTTDPHNWEDNLRTLCLICHGRADAKRYWASKLGT